VRAVDAGWRPFCSERCQLQDLARWAEGTYRVAGEAWGLTSDPGQANPGEHGEGENLELKSEERN
jgi:endogenous inhibitor of DNA gyrase (YacG/DUF329 family)